MIEGLFDSVGTDLTRHFSTDYPFGLLVGRDLVENHDGEYKFGFSDAIGTTQATVWDGAGTTELVAYPGSAVNVKVSSSDVDDTSAGAGLRTLTVYGLDADWDPQSEEVTLNGQTEVTTANTYIRVFRAVGETAGATGSNEGTIWFGDGTVTLGVPATKFMAISPGENQTLHCGWSVGRDRTASLRLLFASSFSNANAFATVRLVARPFGGIWQTKDKFTVSRGKVDLNHNITVKFDPKTDFEVRAVANSGTIDVSAAFEAYIYEQNV